MTRVTRLYIATIVLAAAGLAFVLVTASPLPTLRVVVLALTFSGLMLLAMHYPVESHPQMKVYLDSSVTIASILLFPPGLAMLLVGLGVFVAERLRRASLAQRLFNTAQIMLQAGIGGLILRTIGWGDYLTPFDHPVSFAGFLLAIGAMNLLMVVLVSIVAWLSTARRPAPFSRGIIWDTVVVELPTQAALGVLAAAITHVNAWLLPLLVLVGIAIHRPRTRHLELQKQTEVLAHQAAHDALTRLPNRAQFLDCLVEALSQVEASHSDVAVLFLDLDNFKVVNDTLGHEAGDQLLILVAERLQLIVGQAGTVARLAGDEFTILLRGVEDWRVAMEVADRLVTGLRVPFTLDGDDFVTTASLGVAVGSADASTAEDLLRHADLAMYEAKRHGKGQSVLFEEGMVDARRQQPEFESDLRHALRDGEFRLAYQPVIDLRSGMLLQVEALVRWEHPKRGLLPPSEFIGFAEEKGLIVPIGKWILTEAVRQVQAWQADHSGVPPLKVSVNLSSQQLQDPSLVPDISDILHGSGLDPRQLMLELRESFLLEATESTLAQLRSLRQMGCSIVIDDFGTGYSSLGSLTRFPVDAVKIDRAFVAELGNTATGTATVRVILAVAQTLQLTTTAEGIETAEQLAKLRVMGCMHGQGYYVSRPLSVREIDSLAKMVTPLRLVDVSPEPVGVTQRSVDVHGDEERFSGTN